MDLPLIFTGNATFVGTDDLNLGTGAASLTVTPTITVTAKFEAHRLAIGR